MDSNTPNYILTEETKSEEIKDIALKRAFKYEEIVRNSEKELVKECLWEREKEKEERTRNQWEEKRKKIKIKLRCKKMNWRG